MNIINYYQNYLKCFNVRLVEDEYDSFKQYSHTNLYLYLFEKEIKGPETITLCRHDCKFIRGTYAKYDKYIIFIPYNDFIFVLDMNTDTVCLSFYTKELSVVYFKSEDIFNFLDWIEIDDLKDKIKIAFDFLTINLHIFNNFSYICKENNDYTSKYTANIYKSVDYFAHHESWICGYNSLYYKVIDKNGEQFYLNVGSNGYNLDTNLNGVYGGIIYHLNLNNKSILLVNPYGWTDIILVLFKNDKTIIKNEKFTHIKTLLKLITRDDLNSEIDKFKDILFR